MATVRISMTPGTKKDKEDRYLVNDIKRKNTKYLKSLIIISTICVISIICNIIQFYKH